MTGSENPQPRRSALPMTMLKGGLAAQPTVAVVVPIYNERQHATALVHTLISQDYAALTEIWLVDGGSTDGTLDDLHRLKALDARVRVIENPRKSQAAALNLVREGSRCDVQIRMDAHAYYGLDFVSRSVGILLETGAGGVGPVARPWTKQGAIAQAIGAAHESPLGMGVAKFRRTSSGGWVDTIWGGCFWRHVLIEVGPWREDFLRTEDNDFNTRVRQLGYGLFLSPQLTAYYRPRANLRTLCGQCFANGSGVIHTLLRNPAAIRVRHLIPGAALVLGGSGLFTAISLQAYGWLLGGIGLAAAVLGATALQSFVKRPGAHALLLPIVLPAIHIAYGLGSLVQLARSLQPPSRNGLSELRVPPPVPRTTPPPLVSVLMPVYNEEGFIHGSLGSILQQDYPNFEVLVIDGLSNDRTRDIVREYQQRHPNLRLVDNPDRIVPPGMNHAVEDARGDIVARVDGHSEFPKDYVSQLVHLIETTKADDVGGVLVPVGKTYIAKAIAAAYYSPVSIGPAQRGHFETTVVREVDTVHGGCWRKAALIGVGKYDETMVRNEDDELSFRLRKAGGRIVQSTGIRIRYWVRSSFRKLFWQFAQYGYWKVRVISKHPQQSSARHFLPSLFCIALGLTLVVGLFWPPAEWLAASIGISYLLGITCIAGEQARRSERKLWPGIMLALALMHFGYGFGFILGCLRQAAGPLPTDPLFERVTR